MGIVETPKILILKRSETKLVKTAKSLHGILPEKVDKQSSHKEQLAKATESPCVILLKGVDKQPSPRKLLSHLSLWLQ